MRSAGERGQGVLDRLGRLGLARLAGGVDALLLQALDRVVFAVSASAIASSGSETQKATLDRLVAGETTSTSAPRTSSPSALRRKAGVDRLRGDDEQLHALRATPGRDRENASGPRLAPIGGGRAGSRRAAGLCDQPGNAACPSCVRQRAPTMRAAETMPSP